MNGRLYDPVLKGFLSPDNFVQDSQNSQNLNRYAYCLNNPLKYTDPNGEEIIIAGSAFVGAVVVGAIIGGVVYTGITLYNGTFSWGGLLKNTLLGAVSGAAASGVGSLVSTAFPVVASGGGTAVQQIGVAMFQAGAHGATQGAIAGISGGNFATSFVSGALGSTASSLFQAGLNNVNIGETGKDIGTMLFGSVSGGVGSKLTGGNFWEGAAIGLTVSALNHLAHKFTKKSTAKWDLDGDGKLSLGEANSWYRNGNGKEIFVDASKIDLAFISSSDLSTEEYRSIQTLSKSEDGRVYGNITMKLVSTNSNRVKILPDTYNFEMHSYRSFNVKSLAKTYVRNTATMVGQVVAGFGSSFQINFDGYGYIGSGVSSYIQPFINFGNYINNEALKMRNGFIR